MTTTRDVIKRTLGRLAYLSDAQDLQANDAQVCLDALNDLMHSWESQDLNYMHATIPDVSATFPLQDKHLAGVAAMLALRIADDFGVAGNITQRLRDDAENGWHMLVADYWTDTKATVDETLIYLPSRRYVSDLISE